MAEKEEDIITNGNALRLRWEIIATSVSCLATGSLYLLLFLTLPLQSPINWVIMSLGALLLIIAPVLSIFTYREAWRSNAQKLLKLLYVGIALFVASILSIIIAWGKTIGLLYDMKQPLWAGVFIVYVSLCLVIIVIAEIFAAIRKQ